MGLVRRTYTHSTGCDRPRDPEMVLNTLTVGAAVTPTVIKTYASHVRQPYRKCDSFTHHDST